MVATEISGVWGVQLDLFSVTRLLRKYATNKNQQKLVTSYLTSFDDFMIKYPNAESWKLDDELSDEAFDSLYDLVVELSGFWEVIEGVNQWSWFQIDLGEDGEHPLMIYRLHHDLRERSGHKSAADLFVLGEKILTWSMKSSFAPKNKGEDRWAYTYRAILTLKDPRDKSDIAARQNLIEKVIPELATNKPKMNIVQDDCACCS